MPVRRRSRRHSVGTTTSDVRHQLDALFQPVNPQRNVVGVHAAAGRRKYDQ